MRAVSPKRLWRRGVSKRAIGPEESPNSRVSRLWRRKSPEKSRTAEKNKTQGVDLLTTLPHDVLLTILGFLPVEEVDENVKLVCKSMSRECDSKALWRFFCERTGKMNVPVSGLTDSNPFREHYYRVPCVPVDFATVTSAMSRCPAGGTISLMPGVYEERLEIRRSVHIRAAFPEKGAAIAWYKGVNEPCIAVMEDDIHDGVAVFAEISNVQLLHSTEGSDIWGGNCAVMVEGRKNRLSLTSCCIQSESGRGVVAVTGSYLEVKSTVVHDCAATGLYVGDSDSIATVSGCNLVRNGGGSRRPPRDDEEDDMDRVPPGHSGMYVEAGRASVDNSLVAGNSLTGLSIVRGGGVIISGCDITENGSEPILVEDAFEADPAVRSRNRRPIGVEEGPERNNYSSRSGDLPSLQNVIHFLVEFGGKVRATQFQHVVASRLMSTEVHESRYRA